MRHALLVVMAFVLVAFNAHAAEYKAVSSGVRYTHMGDYSVERLNKILTTEVASFSSFKVQYPEAANAVSLYKVQYTTVIPEQGNKPTLASGLVAVPQPTLQGTGQNAGQAAKKRLPVVSYQHGTVFTRTAVPSRPEESDETRIVTARLAGNGYVVIAADYIGKGDSAEPDSYMVREATVQACMDMLFAARAVLADLGIEEEGLYLSGWSQGSWSTQQFRHRLESLNMPVKAAATAATPADLYLLLTRWINNPTALDATWLAGSVILFTHSYAYYYDMPGLPQTIIKPEYQAACRDFFENRIGWEQLQPQIPAKIADLLQKDVTARSSAGVDSFFRTLRENQAFMWRSATPCRYYYGKVDEVMPPYVSTLAAGYTEAAGGAKAEAVYAGDMADHRGSFLYGVKDQKEFFDSKR